MKICSSVLRIVLVSLSASAIGIASSQTAAADPTNTPAAIPPGTGPSATAMVPGLPFGASEVVKMYQGGIGKDVIVNYVDNAVLAFHLTADNIIYLQSLGIPQEITKAIILRDGQLQQQAMSYQQQMAANPANQAAYSPPTQQPQEPVMNPSTPPPQVAYPAPGYDAGSVYYDAGYPYYYGPDVVIGGGWWPGFYPGWGWGGYRGGFRGGFRGGGRRVSGWVRWLPRWRRVCSPRRWRVWWRPRGWRRAWRWRTQVSLEPESPRLDFWLRTGDNPRCATLFDSGLAVDRARSLGR